jgi:hypothetical protein
MRTKAKLAILNAPPDSPENVWAHGHNPKRSNRRSCDRCYGLKIQCRFQPQVVGCSRCEVIGAPCKTERLLPRRGRRPGAGSWGSTGLLCVWETNGKPVQVEDISRKGPRHVRRGISQSIVSMKGAETQPNFTVIRILHAKYSQEQLRGLQDENPAWFYATNDIYMLGPSFVDNVGLITTQIAYKSALVVSSAMPMVPVVASVVCLIEELLRSLRDRF